jgi:TolB-like protein/tetratricopeptide (TPR) repeat protein
VAAAMVLVIAGVVTWQATRSSEPDSEVPSEDPVLTLPKGPSIAVLPFTNMSGDPEQEYFADGITDEIITELTRFRDLFVIARNSTFQYTGQSVDVREVGRKLGVRYVLEGSVRKAADTIRVSAQLLDATTGTHLWAETYDRDLTAANILSVQDDITEQVVATIAGTHGVISRVGLEGTRGKGTENLEAYDCVIRAQAYFAVFSPDEHLRTRTCLERAVELDPDYSDAWAWLILIYTDEYAFGFNPRPNSLDRAAEVARRAVDLDPTNQMAHWFFARAQFFRHELDSFFVEAERALALNPNNATVLASAGSYLAYAGKWERGLALVKKAVALNPHHPGWYYFPFFWDHYRKAEYEEALAQAQKINLPGLFWTYVTLAAGYGQLGRKEEAQAAVADLLELYPDYPENARHEFRKYNWSEDLIENIMDGLRKAGLNIPPNLGDFLAFFIHTFCALQKGGKEYAFEKDRGQAQTIEGYQQSDQGGSGSGSS